MSGQVEAWSSTQGSKGSSSHKVKLKHQEEAQPTMTGKRRRTASKSKRRHETKLRWMSSSTFENSWPTSLMKGTSTATTSTSTPFFKDRYQIRALALSKGSKHRKPRTLTQCVSA